MEILAVIGVVLVLFLAAVGAYSLTEKSQLIKAKLRAEVAKLKAEERDITTETEAWLKQEEARLKVTVDRAARWAAAEAATLKADFVKGRNAVEAEVKKAL